ncbi:MAG: hypothetical protein IIV56_02585, partial [Mailhella sp.]|nr:hypothetical protein [Mailhella sp.]
IPIALVNDAGITTTGAVSENNELPKLEEEFAAYRDGLFHVGTHMVEYFPSLGAGVPHFFERGPRYGIEHGFQRGAEGGDGEGEDYGDDEGGHGKGRKPGLN